MEVPAADAARPITEVETEGTCLSDLGLTVKHIRIRERGLNNVPGR